MLLTVVFGVPFIMWYLSNSSHLRDPYTDQLAAWGDLWNHLRWPLLGFGVFALGWLWGLAAGLQIVYAAKSAEAAGKPPLLN